MMMQAADLPPIFNKILRQLGVSLDDFQELRR